MRDRRLLLVLGALALAALAWGGVRYGRRLAQQESQALPLALQFFKNPAPVPSLSMQTLDGRTLSSDDWRGKVTIVNFWATWCGPCRAEVPDLIALQETYGEQLQIIGVSEDEGGTEVVQAFVDQYRINYPIVMKTPEIDRAFPGIYALPTSFILDREGRIVQRHVGLLDKTTTELETRSLAGLPANVSVEYVEYEDANKKLNQNAAQATKIPGIDLDALSPATRAAVLKALNAENCTCGCALTLAACRINDPTCTVSLPIAQKIVDEARGDLGAAPNPSR